MNTNKETARNLLDVRIILAVLWVAEVLSSLNGDTYRLSDSVALKSLLENTGSIKATPGLLLVKSLGKSHHRHTLCCDYSCILGFRFCIAIC
jgi:hypothetical protein